MKDNFKSIAISIATILTIGSVTFIACDKDDAANQLVQTDNSIQAKTNTLYYVASIPDTLPKVEEDYPLLFDKDTFLIEYAKKLEEKTGHKWVGENVKVGLFQVEKSTKVPMLQVSAYDLTKQRESNFYMTLTQKEKNKKHYYAINIKKCYTLKCTGTGVCSTGTMCYPYQTNSGEYDCYPCVTTLGTCTREVSVTVEKQAVLQNLPQLP